MYPGHFCGPRGKLEFTHLNVEGVVGDVHGALAHVDGLGQQRHVALVVHLHTRHVSRHTCLSTASTWISVRISRPCSPSPAALYSTMSGVHTRSQGSLARATCHACHVSRLWSPGVADVVVVVRVPHEEHVVPLGDHLAVGRHGLSSLVLPHDTCQVSRVSGVTCYHVHDVVERHLQRDVDHVVRVGGGQHVVAGRVVTQQVHRQLRDRDTFSIFNCGE